MKLDIADRWSTAYQEYYPRIFKVSLYRAKDSKEKIYLSVRDAKILGFEYDKEDKIVIDDFEYHKRLSEAGPEGDSLLSRMIDLLVNDLIPNTESIADEGEEDMKKMYEERLERIWEMMPNDYQG